MSQDVKAGGKSLWPIPIPPVSNSLRLRLSISFNFPVDETNGSIHGKQHSPFFGRLRVTAVGVSPATIVPKYAVLYHRSLALDH